jgi:hypothetical protein
VCNKWNKTHYVRRYLINKAIDKLFWRPPAHIERVLGVIPLISERARSAAAHRLAIYLSPLSSKNLTTCGMADIRFQSIPAHNYSEIGCKLKKKN